MHSAVLQLSRSASSFENSGKRDVTSWELTSVNCSISKRDIFQQSYVLVCVTKIGKSTRLLPLYKTNRKALVMTKLCDTSNTILHKGVNAYEGLRSFYSEYYWIVNSAQKRHWEKLLYMHTMSRRKMSQDLHKGNSQARCWQNWLVRKIDVRLCANSNLEEPMEMLCY